MATLTSNDIELEQLLLNVDINTPLEQSESSTSHGLCIACRRLTIDFLVLQYEDYEYTPSLDNPFQLDGDGHQTCLHSNTWADLRESSGNCPLCMLMYAALLPLQQMSQQHRYGDVWEASQVRLFTELIDSSDDEYELGGSLLPERLMSNSKSRGKRMLGKGVSKLLGMDLAGDEYADERIPDLICRLIVRISGNSEQIRRLGGYGGRSAPLRLNPSIGSHENLQHRLTGRPLARPDSDINFARIRDWLNNCKHHHPMCQIAMSGEKLDDKGETTSLPTRVIDVGDEPFSIPKLRTSNEEQGPYVALSYCWGTCEVVKTLSTNIESFHKALPLDRLPQTIKDAITVTRRLGFRYLWVDALCIIQDDHDDWAAEAKRMSSVYQYAFLTIAAISGVEATSGLFTPKPPEQSVYIDGLQFSMPLATLDEELDRSKWNTRGWVMQERFLSRRLVHYAHSQLYFECKEGYISEGDQNAYHSEKSKNSGFDTIATNDNHEYQSRFSERSRKLNFRLDSIGRHSDDMIVEYWGNFVYAYMKRELTQEKDKLAAIEGLSQAVSGYIVNSKRSKHEKSATKHLAGMLIDGLFQQLKWWPSRKATRCATFRGMFPPDRGEHPGRSGYLITRVQDIVLTILAPSWSWASWYGVVYLAKAAESKYKTAIEEIEFIGGKTPLCDEVGAQFGALQMTGYIKSFKVGPRKNLYKKEQCSFDLLAKTTVNRITGFSEKKATKPRAGYRVKGGYIFLDETPEDRPENVECLLLFTSSGSEYNEHALNHFMVLEKVASKNVYRRLGIGVVEDQSGSKLFSSLFKSAWAKERNNVILV